jgi:hypothetical protein
MLTAASPSFEKSSLCRRIEHPPVKDEAIFPGLEEITLNNIDTHQPAIGGQVASWLSNLRAFCVVVNSETTFLFGCISAGSLN